MKIICSTNMPFASEAFGTLGDVTILEGRNISAAQVRDCDVLAIRSTTLVDAGLLEGSRVRFVGTATIGTDHLDTAFLNANGIRWCFAPGCNANSVSEYIAAALLCLARRHGLRLANLAIGVIGVGNVGHLVAQKARILGLRVLLNDPPRARAGDQEDFQPLDRLLAEADILTLHVPLTDHGPDATRHMANDVFFAQARKGLIFINASRGAVVRTASLLHGLSQGHIEHTVIDTWENEPRISRPLLGRVDLGTPHIAGHSFEGKVEGTMMVYREACRFLGCSPTFDPTPHLPPPEVPHLDLCDTDTDGGQQASVDRAVRAVYDIEQDDRRLRAASTGSEPVATAAFDDLRRHYPQRREFRFTKVRLPVTAGAAAGQLAGLGFRVVN